MNTNTSRTPIAINETTSEVAVTSADLPLACPRPGAPLWARHPRVFIDVLRSETGEAACPYCGTRYRFSGERPSGHH